MVAASGFDPPTSGLWAQHASTAQVLLDEESSKYTAFAALGRQYQYNVLAMGLCGAPAYFQQTMNRVFEGMIGKSLLVYLDDVLALGETWEEHLQNLRHVFERLRKANLKLKATKCRFAMDRVKFLGHELSADGISKDSDKIQPIRDYPVPKSVKELQSFLGVLGYYRKFVLGYAQIAAPLNELLRKDIPFEWTPARQSAFDTLKSALCENVTLSFPDFPAAANDPARRLTIQSDACKTGLGAVLCQRDEQGRMRPIYLSLIHI